MSEASPGLISRVGAIADSPGDTPEDRLRHRFLIATGATMSGGGIWWGTMAVVGEAPRSGQALVSRQLAFFDLCANLVTKLHEQRL